MDRFTGSWLIALTALIATTLPLKAQDANGIAAIVNDKVITFSEVKKQVGETEKLLRDNFSGTALVDKVKEARLNALRALIERQLIIQDFSTKGFNMPQNIIDDRLKDVIKEQFDNDRSAFVKTLAANGISIEQYKIDLKEQIIVQAMRARNVTSSVLISPFRIEQYYQENVKSFVQDDQIKLSVIFLKKALFPEKRKNIEGVEEEYDPQLELAVSIANQANQGGDFAALARKYSEDSRKEQGGDRGWVQRGKLDKDLAVVAFKLKPGETAKPLKFEDGIYILHVDDRKRSSVVPLGEVRAQIEKTLIQDERQRLQQEWLDGLRGKAFIKMF
jgi:parvulin-like peptidyl-prolyl isomerase